MKVIAFTGGGTGGHIYPGLAVASELKKHLKGEYRLFWIGSSSGMDRSIVEAAGIEFFGVPSGKLRRYFSFRTAVDFFKVFAGFFASIKILKKQKANILFSKGGFVSVPPCAAASLLKIPVYTHESDYSPGLATKLNARYALRTGGKIFTAYEDTVRFFAPAMHNHIIVSGQPVRDVFRNINAPSKERTLLVLGGSQGADEVNKLILAALPQLNKWYTVIHQTGPGKQWDVKETEKYKPYPYIKDELPYIMKAAEIVIGRSGAGIWEWAVCGKPMILIPLTGSGTRGDQSENARYFEKANAAIVLEGANVNSQILVDTVTELANDAEKRKKMAESSSKIGEIDASAVIARILEEKINEL
ncbi:MAG: undecaprenyldiphospho-muramoylpentapeptide beta-N-acetylglucosaminyltransferase [Treponema sp.]|jgi:UDP-N-acetylglucosamine--N-acetylmuramyl-(pentapeptide) pyrophosphoryl-undecaprenol N-acetylglucosamine transferase|nr:undecaprenyldiphospho-muramoylpentapeptide beta-N-acetylglucosaminyltransferase [Treponema sp.]